ncbi:NAD(P)/FAD-dependent oxidoreductase [Virgibacillus salexigens]|uniref:Sarcosine oxidase subunit alpha n=1 Tax=Virgibacillus kapii TaxID=1638645 RepID=A0ABQ2D1T8_9BACI|nr:FAD-dependent oxidoreductase [Virgibacillus kapii]GGJ42119.1 sarcosine oxidase subunit alpha [Virgibacillus kapii]
MSYDLVVIGAGPAGMSAAIKAASHGVNVALIDEQPIPGGKLNGQLHQDGKGDWWIGQEVAENLASTINKLSIPCFYEREVWGIDPNWKVMLDQGELLETKNIILATGAAEKSVPVPGWTKPGVMTIGAAQVLTNFHRIKPGEKAAIIGIDALSLTVAQAMKLGGIDVVGIFLFPPESGIDLKPKQVMKELSNLSHLAPNVWLRTMGKLVQGNRIQTIATTLYPKSGMKIGGVPIYLKKTITDIIGKDKVEQINIGSHDHRGRIKRKSQIINVDCVCLSGGLYPLLDLAKAVGCATSYIPSLGGEIPLYNGEMETSQPGIFIAGNITGIEGAKVAMAQGELAGTAVSSKLGKLKSSCNILRKARKRVENERDRAVFSFQANIGQGREKVKTLWKQLE